SDSLRLHLCAIPIISFFFHAPSTTQIYTLSLHDALPICQALVAARGLARRADDDSRGAAGRARSWRPDRRREWHRQERMRARSRSEEHTSELQSLAYLVCRLLLEKKKKKTNKNNNTKNVI